MTYNYDTSQNKIFLAGVHSKSIFRPSPRGIVAQNGDFLYIPYKNLSENLVRKSSFWATTPQGKGWKINFKWTPIQNLSLPCFSDPLVISSFCCSTQPHWSPLILSLLILQFFHHVLVLEVFLIFE